MAKGIGDIKKDVKKHKEALNSAKKEFKGDGKLDVYNTTLTLSGYIDTLETQGQGIVSSRKKIADDNTEIERLKKEIDTLQKGFTKQLSDYNDTLNMVKTSANVIKGLITKNKLDDKAKDTKGGDFSGLLSNVADLNAIRELQTKA